MVDSQDKHLQTGHESRVWILKKQEVASVRNSCYSSIKVVGNSCVHSGKDFCYFRTLVTWRVCFM